MKRITKSDLQPAISELLQTDSLPPEFTTATASGLSQRGTARVRQLELVRQKREIQQQDVGFSSRPFTLCNLPVRPMKNRVAYERRNGKFFLRIEAGQGKEL